MFEQFKNTLLKDILLKERYSEFFTKIKVPAKYVLLQQGDISKKFYWIEKGCVRVWFNNNGKDTTFQFFFENSAVSSLESFRKNIESNVTVETLEPSVLWVIEKENYKKIITEITENPIFRELYIDAIYERTFDYMHYFFSSIKDTPTQRYQELLLNSPEIVQRIPQHYIASYLGITTVHLSRIKSKLLKP